MTNLVSRREFVAGSAAVVAGACLAVHTSAAAQEAVRPLRVGVMGLSRGRDLAKDLAKQPNVSIAYLCDVDSERLAACQNILRDVAEIEPEGIADFRPMLDDKTVDAIFCAAPNHWHAPATILACKAGKDVYVEKPCSQNPAEGELMTAAAAKYGRVVQMGTQRRSAKSTQEAVKKLRAGVIGNVYLARAFYGNARTSIGHTEPSKPPATLNYELWQGPAKHQPYKSNVVHYNWHWFWDWGNGELGNNGVHFLDVCRWGMNVTIPTRVTSTGGRLVYDDDQQTPDTQDVAYEYPGKKMILWQHMSCSPRVSVPGMVFHGTEGVMELDGGGEYRIYDQEQKLVEHVTGSGWGQEDHIANFLDAVRASDASTLNQPIGEGAISTLACHLGNIAQRVGRPIVCDPVTGRILGDAEAMALWTREYDRVWEKDVTTI